MERDFIFREFGLGKITFQEVERDFVGRHSESGCDFGRGEGESCHRLVKKKGHLQTKDITHSFCG